jgi:site-specific recombinase XerD
MKVVAGLHSALAEPIRTFVEYKRALNRKYRPESAALRLFDGYLCEHDATGWNSIDSILIENFLQSRPRSRPRSYNHLLGVLHRFFEWAVLQGFRREQSREGHATPRYRKAHSISLRPQ